LRIHLAETAQRHRQREKANRTEFIDPEA